MHTPLFLTPALKDYLWGGDRLPREYGYDTALDRVAEAWVLSCHPQGESVVRDGEHAGKSLAAVLASWGDAALGARAAVYDRFPLLIKLIDARDRLSVQVHPDDEYALRAEGEYGKTEMWYVVDCDEGARLLYGVDREMTADEFRRHIEAGTLDEVSRYVTVKRGDVFFIPSGTLHAIGEGILIAEVQQNSATTYRVSDYGRVGADGKPRELHIDKAVDVTRLVPTPLSADGLWRRGDTVRLAECAYFTSEFWRVDGEHVTPAGDSFRALLCLDGEGVLTAGGVAYSVRRGDSVFIPADVTATVSGKMEILCSEV